MSTIEESHLSNKDLAPTGVEQRTWGTYHLAALWVGLSIVITTYTLASGLIAAGMTWWQGLLTVSLGNFIVLIPILLELASGHEVRHPVPGARALELRHPRRERRRDGAGARGLRLVRHPDVDRRARAGHADDHAVVRLGRRHRPQGDRVRRLLGDPGGDHPARHRGHQVPRELRRAAAAGLERRAADLGLRRRRQRLLGVVAAGHRRRELLVAVRARPGGERRLLDHAVDEHPGLHALREGPALAGRRPEHRHAADDDRLLVHRHRRDVGDDRRVRRADLGPGRARRACCSTTCRCCWCSR